MKGEDVFYIGLTLAVGFVGYRAYRAASDTADGASDFASNFASFINPWSEQRETNAEAAKWAASIMAVRRDPKGRLFLVESLSDNKTARIRSQFLNGVFVRLPTPQPLPLNGWQSWPIVSVSAQK